MALIRPSYYGNNVSNKASLILILRPSYYGNFVLGSRDPDERFETVRKIKEAIRRSMIEDSDILSRRKPSTASALSTNSIHLGFPAVPGHLRRSFSYQPGRARSKHMAGKQYSAGDVKTYSALKQKR